MGAGGVGFGPALFFGAHREVFEAEGHRGVAEVERLGRLRGGRRLAGGSLAAGDGDLPRFAAQRGFADRDERFDFDRFVGEQGRFEGAAEVFGVGQRALDRPGVALGAGFGDDLVCLGACGEGVGEGERGRGGVQGGVAEVGQGDREAARAFAYDPRGGFAEGEFGPPGHFIDARPHHHRLGHPAPGGFDQEGFAPGGAAADPHPLVVGGLCGEQRLQFFGRFGGGEFEAGDLQAVEVGFGARVFARTQAADHFAAHFDRGGEDFLAFELGRFGAHLLHLGPVGGQAQVARPRAAEQLPPGAFGRPRGGGAQGRQEEGEQDQCRTSSASRPGVRLQCGP